MEDPVEDQCERLSLWLKERVSVNRKSQRKKLLLEGGSAETEMGDNDSNYFTLNPLYWNSSIYTFNHMKDPPDSSSLTFIVLFPVGPLGTTRHHLRRRFHWCSPFICRSFDFRCD